MGVDMDFRILGQLEVVADGKPAAVTMPKVRILLAALLLRPDRMVGVDELVDRLWDDNPPRTPRPTLQTCVRRLRQSIGDPSRIVTATHGYQIVIEQDELDLHRFRALVERAGRQENPADESRLLDEALRQWRGYALADVLSHQIQSVDVPILEEERLGALERRFDVELTLGHHANLVRELQVAIGEYPMRERFYSQLMLALYRSGRQADAFVVYQNIRDVLAAELGVDPSEELRTIRQHILTNDPAIAAPPSHDPVTTVHRIPIPRELPPDVGDFVGRADVRARLSDLLVDDTGVGLAVIVGPPGVGKTALAVKVAHELHDRFPDGQLYADMRGYSSAPELTAAEVLARFLVSLGTPTTQTPSDPDELAALYRSRLADHRVLIVLDNVVNPHQVRPLLPGVPGCAVIVTSRNELRGLTALQSARPIGLDVLPAEQSRDLLGAIVGRDIVADDPAGVTELAELCGHLPLALRIAAANLLARHDSVLAGYLVELRANRLSALEIDGDDQSAVRAAFRLSYRTLDERAAQAFRLLGLIPGQDFTAEAVAALAALPVPEAGRVLDQLVAGNLVVRSAGRRYQLHDLLRVYATELYADADAEPATTDARARLFLFYTMAVDAAAELVFPIWRSVPRPDPDPAVPQVRFADTVEARSWMDRECLNVLDVVLAGVQYGCLELVWPMTETTRAYLVSSGRYRAEAVTTYTVALRAAVAAGSRTAEGALLFSLGRIHMVHKSLRRAEHYYAEALRVYEEIDDEAGQIRALVAMGTPGGEAGELDRAADYITRGVELAVKTDSPQALYCWSNLSFVELLRGNLDQAQEAATAALGLHEYDDTRLYEASVRTITGQVLVRRGRCVDAIDEYRQAMMCYRRTSMPINEISALACLSEAYREIGDLTAALDHALLAIRLVATEGTFDSHVDGLVALGDVQRVMGRHDEAGVNYRKALDYCGRLEGLRDEISVLLGYSESSRARGNLAAAAELADRTVTLAQQGGYRLQYAQAVTISARIWLDRGDAARAVAVAQDAVRVSRRLGARLDEARASYVEGLAHQASGASDLAWQSWQAANDALIGTNLPDTAEIRQLLASVHGDH